MQKGIDLIADVFPGIIEKHQSTQLICIGPVVDLYGKFAALKLEKLATLYPGRVCLKSEASVVPPYIFGSRRIRSHTIARRAFRESGHSVWAKRSSECRCPGWGFGKHAWMVVHH